MSTFTVFKHLLKVARKKKQTVVNGRFESAGMEAALLDFKI